MRKFKRLSFDDVEKKKKMLAEKINEVSQYAVQDAQGGFEQLYDECSELSEKMIIIEAAEKYIRQNIDDQRFAKLNNLASKLSFWEGKKKEVLSLLDDGQKWVIRYTC